MQEVLHAGRTLTDATDIFPVQVWSLDNKRMKIDPRNSASCVNVQNSESSVTPLGSQR